MQQVSQDTVKSVHAVEASIEGGVELGQTMGHIAQSFQELNVELQQLVGGKIEQTAPKPLAMPKAKSAAA